MIPFSILDLSPIVEGATAGDALRNSVSLAKAAERLGYRRFWLAEHHNMPGIASAATAVVIGQVAGATRTIRVGAGGVMLPNHAPLVIAEQFGTLESLYPGRIDLGLGRAPGTDMLTARALRRELKDSDVEFPAQCAGTARVFRGCTARTKNSCHTRCWTEGARLAFGLKPIQRAAGSHTRLAFRLRFSFCTGPAHASPRCIPRVISGPRSGWTGLMRWWALMSIAAESDNEALRLFTSVQQSFINLRRGRPGELPRPIERIEDFAAEQELAGVSRALAISFVGGRDKVRQGLASFLRTVDPEEL